MMSNRLKQKILDDVLEIIEWDIKREKEAEIFTPTPDPKDNKNKSIMISANLKNKILDEIWGVLQEELINGEEEIAPPKLNGELTNIIIVWPGVTQESFGRIYHNKDCTAIFLNDEFPGLPTDKETTANYWQKIARIAEHLK